MEFRRITSLPPYVFTIIDSLKVQRRRDGADIIDLGFGNPDLASPEIAVNKLAEAAVNFRIIAIRRAAASRNCVRRWRTCTSAVSMWISIRTPR